MFKGLFFSLFIVSELYTMDTLDSLLYLLNQSKNDLGYRPKGYFIRYPQPQLPYKLYAFDDLFREPLEIYNYTRALGNVVQDYLSDSFFTKNDIVLHRMLYFLGVDRKVTGFRNYSTNLNPEIFSKHPLKEAITKIRELTGPGMNNLIFGGTYGKDTIRGIQKIPLNLRLPIAELLLNILDAYKWWEISVRNVPSQQAIKLLNSPDLMDLGDDRVYLPEFDDIAKALDEHSLYYSAMKLIDAVNKFAFQVDSLLKHEKVKDFLFQCKTPIGKIVIAGSGNDTLYFEKPPLLFLDLGGNDLIKGRLASGCYGEVPVSVAIDMKGDDIYLADSTISQGAGILGNGILVDWQGNDRFIAGNLAQGIGVLGCGVLFDNTGNDTIKAALKAQGCGVNGIGLLINRKGDDYYYLYGAGQGAGFAGGIGVLVDRYGDDYYEAEPFSAVYDLGDYHSKYKINANAAQGFGGGRRGDGSDGHSYAGGLGLLVDVSGNDFYYSGNWTLGVGYFYGIGLVWDGEGDDIYKSCYFTQGSGAHYAIGALIDESGNDRHELYETAGAALGFGWDFVNALMFDRSGDDIYRAKIISQGVAEIRSNAFFIDLSGNDEYYMDSLTLKWGAADYRESYEIPNRYSPYSHSRYSKEFGIFIDGAGNDRYFVRGKKGNLRELEREKCVIFNPAKGIREFGYNNFGIFADLETAIIEDFEFWRK